MNILSIDTSNQALGLAVMQGDAVIAELMTNTQQDHSSRLMPAITDLLARVGMEPGQLDAIAVAAGPGSYTGTRIGITTAKTLAWALEIPIHPISSLAGLAYNGALFNGYICPFFDARRKTVFTGLYKFENNNVTAIETDRNQPMETWLKELKQLDEEILFLSPHVSVFKDMITEILGDKAIIPEANVHLPQAANLCLLSKTQPAVNAHEVIPNYLRITEAEANWLKQQKDDDQRGSNEN